MQLNKLDLNNKLLLILNKKIEKFPHNKVNDKLGGYLNQNIIFNFSNKNVNTDRRLKNNINLASNKSLPAGAGPKFSLINDQTEFKNVKGGQNAIKLLRSKISDFGPVLVKTPSRLGIINNVVKILTSFFKELNCLIGRPQLINKADKLIIKIVFYQNNTNKESLLSNNKLNFIFNLFNGKAAAKAQYSAPKSQNFSAIIRDMLGQTKWNKIAQQILASNNNETFNTLELANISKKVFMFFIKDLMNLTVSKKGISIEKALSELQKGKLNTFGNKIAVSNSLGGKKGAIMSGYNNRNKLVSTTTKRHNQLVMKLINSTNSESLSRKRTRLSKTFFNKSLLAKLRNNINMYNSTDSLDVHFRSTKGRGKKNIAFKELIGKNALMNPVTKAKLNNLLEWSPDNLDLSSEYKLISKALLLLLEAKNKSAASNVSGKSDIHAKKAKILANKINKNLILLSKQFTEGVNNNTNFIARTLRPLNSFNMQEKGHLLAKFASNIQNFPLLDRLNGGILNLINKNLSQKALIKNTSSPNSHTGNKGGVQSTGDSSITEALLAYKFLNNKNIINEKNNILAAANAASDATNLNRFKLLGTLLTKIFKKNIDLQLIKVHNVGLDSDLISKVISANARFDKTSVLLKKVWRKVNISKASLIQFNKQNKILNGNSLAYNTNLHNKISVPVLSKVNNKMLGVNSVSPISTEKQNISLAQLYDQTKNVNILHTNPFVLGKVVGLNLRVAGRLRSDPIKPKQTVKTVTVGSLSKDRTNAASLGSFTSKNRKGTFRITVKMGQIRTFVTSSK